MDVYIHKDTGKGWILIEELEDGTGYFVSPAPRKMQRPFDEFRDEEETDEDALIRNGIISKEQAQIYHLHQGLRKDEILEKATMILKEMVAMYGKEYTKNLIEREWKVDGAKDLIDKISKDD